MGGGFLAVVLGTWFFVIWQIADLGPGKDHLADAHARM